MCVSADYPHFDLKFPNVSNNLRRTVPRAIAAQILLGGAGLYGFTATAVAAARAPAAVPVGA